MFQLICLCAIIFIGQETGAVMDPGYEYVEEANTWLRLHIVPATWQDALLRCKAEGGMLASPSDTALTKAMLSIMSSNNALSPGVFTGIHDLISEGDFMSLDGIPVSDIQLNWAYSEPSDKNEEENCVRLTSTGQVADERCASKYPYFCRKENATMVIDKGCRTTADGYEYNAITGSCYKFHRVAQTWHRAAGVCHAEGGHLSVINSEIESLVIKTIFENNPADTLFGATHDFIAFIGAWKWNIEDGEWLTVNGQTLDEAGFAEWGDSQPNNLGGDQTVLSVQRGGKLDDRSPHIKESFICEISLGY
ncbi:secretory phospholipase A2 receptor-like [Cydia fagiglandana]|uniref:secretory phospholipase A2 receptor-like n=1 Tax=Cydia fagiglandana TaxID=1458189 RepID=UPI002FEE095D